MRVVQVGHKLIFAGGGVPNFVFYDTATGSGVIEGTLAPNPAADWTFLTFPRPVSGRLSLFDARGTLVLRQDLTQTAQYALSLAALPAGRYVWQWIGEGRGSGQLVVVR